MKQFKRAAIPLSQPHDNPLGNARGVVQVSEIVKCGICGKSFNKRHVNSHKRLAHTKRSNPDSSAWDEVEVMKEILRLYERLSDEERKELQIQLKSLA
jgi:hypothetical protein